MHSMSLPHHSPNQNRGSFSGQLANGVSSAIAVSLPVVKAARSLSVLDRQKEIPRRYVSLPMQRHQSSPDGLGCDTAIYAAGIDVSPKRTCHRTAPIAGSD